MQGLWHETQGESGEWVILLHGFPSSGEGWDALVPWLSARHRVLVHDMLGYGRSHKPIEADYSASAHVDRLLALCDQLGIRRAAFVGHDLGAIVLQQIVHRWTAGQCGVDVLAVAFLNSSLYHHLYRPALIQRPVAVRPLGRLIAKRMSGNRFTSSLARVWGPHPAQKTMLWRIWDLFSADNGHLLAPDHLQYIKERKRSGAQWTQSVEKFERPIALCWGIDDPISGRPVLEFTLTKLRNAQATRLHAGHFPQLEQPAATGKALTNWLACLRQAESAAG